METVTKTDAARRNLAAAIRLFFERGDPIAIHTLGAAAQTIIREVAKSRGLKHTSLLHDHPHIRPEARKVWIDILNTPRNFFKHADKDPNGTLIFDPANNEMLLLDAAITLSEIDERHLSEANVFVGWFTTANPGLRSVISNNQIGEHAVRVGIAPTDFARFRDLIGARILIEPASYKEKPLTKEARKTSKKTVKKRAKK